MKIIKIVIIALVVLGIPAAAYFGYTQIQKVSKDSATVSDSKKTVAEILKEDESFSGSFDDLMKAGTPVKCSYSVEMDEGSSAGTVYVSGENMRLESKVVTSEATVENRSIKIGTTLYTWDPATTTGYQMEVTEDMITGETENEETAEADIPEVVKTLQNDFEYNCAVWEVDETLFELPENVTFVDMSSLSRDIEEAQETGDYCAMCASLPEAQKNECLTNFDCN